MADAATIQAEIEDLKTRIASGVTSIRHGDELTVFDNLDGMQKRLSWLYSQLAAAQAGAADPPKRQRIRYGWQVSKGFGSDPWPRPS